MSLSAVVLVFCGFWVVVLGGFWFGLFVHLFFWGVLFWFFLFPNTFFFLFTRDICSLAFGITMVIWQDVISSFTLLFHSIVADIFYCKNYTLESWKIDWCSSCVQLCFSHSRRLVSFHLLNFRTVKLVLNCFWRCPEFWDQKNVLIPEFADKRFIGNLNSC